MYKKYLIWVLIGLTLFNHSQAKISMLGSTMDIMSEVSELAIEFDLTTEQKSAMRSILMDYLPNIALKASSMIQNRQDLLEASIAQDEIDDVLLKNLAEKQGKLLTGIIISKEHMKKELRNVLTDEQRDFIDALVEIIIQFKFTRQ